MGNYAVSEVHTELFAANGLEIEACESRCREFPAGLTVGRWCELGNPCAEALATIREKFALWRQGRLAGIHRLFLRQRQEQLWWLFR